MKIPILRPLREEDFQFEEEEWPRKYHVGDIVKFPLADCGGPDWGRHGPHYQWGEGPVTAIEEGGVVISNHTKIYEPELIKLVRLATEKPPPPPPKCKHKWYLLQIPCERKNVYGSGLKVLSPVCYHKRMEIRCQKCDGYANDKETEDFWKAAKIKIVKKPI